ncbi:MAG: type I methionyl aminopeptidase [Nocardioides sp.]|nr:type I methionyl aminopeptidase [Nocardioides sp.]
MFGRDRIEYKTADQVRVMRRAGLVVADALAAAGDAAVVGATTADVDAAARVVIDAAGATSNFLGYGHPPFPAVTCVSVNEEVVHGIPGSRVILAGDLVSIDCGAVVADEDGTGWHGDAAVTVITGGPAAADPDDVELSATTERSLWAGIAALVVGRPLGDVGAAVEDAVGERYGILDGYTGHGIGTAMHMAPEVLNYRTRDKGPKVRAGLCVAIEPMCVRGSGDTALAADGWTVVSADGARGAHWEHTVAVHEGGVWVLTARDGGAAGLAPHGVVPVPL